MIKCSIGTLKKIEICEKWSLCSWYCIVNMANLCQEIKSYNLTLYLLAKHRKAIYMQYDSYAHKCDLHVYSSNYTHVTQVRCIKLYYYNTLRRKNNAKSDSKVSWTCLTFLDIFLFLAKLKKKEKGMSFLGLVMSYIPKHCPLKFCLTRCSYIFNGHLLSLQ